MTCQRLFTFRLIYHVINLLYFPIGHPKLQIFFYMKLYSKLRPIHHCFYLTLCILWLHASIIITTSSSQVTVEMIAENWNCNCTCSQRWNGVCLTLALLRNSTVSWVGKRLALLKRYQRKGEAWLKVSKVRQITHLHQRLDNTAAKQWANSIF